MAPQPKLSNLQRELLRIFSFELDEAQLLEIRALLARHFADKATVEMDRLWEANGWTEDTMQGWSQEHLRTAH